MKAGKFAGNCFRLICRFLHFARLIASIARLPRLVVAVCVAFITATRRHPVAVAGATLKTAWTHHATAEAAYFDCASAQRAREEAATLRIIETY